MKILDFRRLNLFHHCGYYYITIECGMIVTVIYMSVDR